MEKPKPKKSLIFFTFVNEQTTLKLSDAIKLIASLLN